MHIFPIGKAAKILGMAESKLRHYDKAGVVKPANQNPHTAYRYYGADQISLLDRVRFLQDMGFTLQEIKTIFKNNRTEIQIPFLQTKKKNCARQINRLLQDIKTIDFYLDYLSELEVIRQYSDDVIYKYVEEKHVFMVDYKNNPDENSGDLELTRILNLPEYRGLRYLRQWGCLLDYGKMLKNHVDIQKSFYYLVDITGLRSPHLFTLPAGYYLCCKGKIFSGELGPLEKISSFFSSGLYHPGLVVANEYEDNFLDSSNCIYEILIQILPG